jgi:hypothetical protein
MEDDLIHLVIEAIGWIASGLTVGAYAMNTMLPLRVLAVLSSVFFLIYGLLLSVWPLVAMELVLLPINVYRLWQLLSLRKKVERGLAGSPNFGIVRRYGKRRIIPADTVLFRKGDEVDQLYLLARGRVAIEEMGVEIKEGEIFGEIAFFTDAATRTATARTLEEVELYELDEKQFQRLQFEDPSFGLAVMRTVTRRLLETGAASPAADLRQATP